MYLSGAARSLSAACPAPRGTCSRTPARKEIPAGNRAGRRAGQTVTKFVKDNIMAKLCAWCLVDEAGEKLFADTDIAALGKKSGVALQRVMEVAMRLSGLDDDDIDDMAKDLQDRPFGDLSSA